MSTINSTSCFSSMFQSPPETEIFSAKMKSRLNFMLPMNHSKMGSSRIFCNLSETESGIDDNPRNGKISVRSKNRMEEYNTAMKRMMRNPYEYHHDLGMNYTLITDNLIVGSQPQKPEDIGHLNQEENVAYILNLQLDKDIEYWGIDLLAIIKRCRQLGIRYMRRPVRKIFSTCINCYSFRKKKNQNKKTSQSKLKEFWEQAGWFCSGKKS
ncbi:hypothetical protein DITRI_Ditri18aG0007500 [Diplodiscus trichospermus]